MTNLELSRTLLDYEAALARLVVASTLEAMPTLGRPPSRAFVASILTGSLRRDVIACDGYRLMTFGVFERFPSREVIAMIEKLAKNGFLDTSHGSRGGLVCTSQGRALLEDECAQFPEALGLVSGVVNAKRLDAVVRSGLLDALRRYRSDRARAEEVPEFQLFSEAILRQIATTLPRTPEDLEKLTGMGPKRIEAHGVQILEIVAEHSPIVERILSTATPDSPAETSAVG